MAARDEKAALLVDCAQASSRQRADASQQRLLCTTPRPAVAQPRSGMQRMGQQFSQAA